VSTPEGFTQAKKPKRTARSESEKSRRDRGRLRSENPSSSKKKSTRN
jgi:hypothetical protein